MVTTGYGTGENLGKGENAALASLPSESEPLLWQAARAGDRNARERLIKTNLPYARMLAAKLYGGRIDDDLEFEEYLQFATIGLIEAVDRYDSARGVLFKTFAGHRIHGAVMSGIEHMSDKREQISARKAVLAERRESSKAALDDKEHDVFHQLAEVAVGLALGFILEEPAVYHHEDAVISQNQYAALELRQLQAQIRAMIERLPPKERMVIKYHYFNHLSFITIAENMGLTKGRVSQLHRQALKELQLTARSIRACDLTW